jgi:hypothetical protein
MLVTSRCKLLQSRGSSVVEQPIRNRQVASSTLALGSILSRSDPDAIQRVARYPPKQINSKIFAPIQRRAQTLLAATNKLQEIARLLSSRFLLAKPIHPLLPAESVPPLLLWATPECDRPPPAAKCATKYVHLQKSIVGSAFFLSPFVAVISVSHLQM